jgi:hypothetical protein
MIFLAIVVILGLATRQPRRYWGYAAAAIAPTHRSRAQSHLNDSPRDFLPRVRPSHGQPAAPGERGEGLH